MQGQKDISLIEFIELKAEVSELEKKNVYIRKIVSDLMAEKTPVKNHGEMAELKANIIQLEGFNKLILKRNEVLQKELSELKVEVDVRDACLEAFQVRESCSKEISQFDEKIKSLEKEIDDLQKGMGKFVQGEEVLKSIMKQTIALLVKE